MLQREVLGTRRMPLLANTRLTIFSFLTEETLSPPYRGKHSFPRPFFKVVENDV